MAGQGRMPGPEKGTYDGGSAWHRRAAPSLLCTLHLPSQTLCSPALLPLRLRVQVQYPGVATSIESDVDNLMRLVSLTNILPKGMYVESAVKVRRIGCSRAIAGTL